MCNQPAYYSPVYPLSTENNNNHIVDISPHTNALNSPATGIALRFRRVPWGGEMPMWASPDPKLASGLQALLPLIAFIRPIICRVPLGLLCQQHGIRLSETVKSNDTN